MQVLMIKMRQVQVKDECLIETIFPETIYLTIFFVTICK